MKTLNLKTLAVIFVMLTSTFAFSQEGENITGKIINSERNAIAYANVAAYDSETNALIGGDLCNNKGVFEIENISSNNYYLRITHLGYSDKIVTNSKKNISIKLIKSQHDLSEIVVTGERIIAENTVEGLTNSNSNFSE